MKQKKILTLIISSFAFFILFCLPVKEKITRKIHHLVIDAGSSGTRFCLYSILRNSQCRLENFNSNCFSIPAKNGIADLNKNEIIQTLNEGFKIIDKKTDHIDYISLLGTGGFRKLNAEEKNQKFNILTNYFKQNTSIPFNIKFISGKEEAYYAWKSISILYHSNNHITIETGGATIQIAIGDNNQFQYISLPLGMNQSYKKLLTYNSFNKCRYGNILSNNDYKDCKNIVKETIYNYQELSLFIEKNKHYINKYQIYTLGKPWSVIFSYIRKNPITIQDIELKGTYFCNLKENDLLKENIPEKFAKQTCYLFYYHQAQLEALKINTVYKGTDSWTIGASIDPSTIPFCN
ncbi:MAG: hypothetical protein KatS3mg129_1108 [Leptospiraceae bacterium]|nr:MAG: hypothetical protein KatS3mg129_1108 [Leptospiraceae bacterium]